ncbi:MAG: DUF6516 family protein [Chloroflexota bacterium]
MSAPFQTVQDYELFLYTLTEQFPSVKRSTLVLIRIGAGIARVSGELLFRNGIRLSVREGLLIDRSPLLIYAYSYEIWRGNEELSWYDPQPHPNEPSLQNTHPHHKHLPPQSACLNPRN